MTLPFVCLVGDKDFFFFFLRERMKKAYLKSSFLT
jgi:hypothetical protein